MKARRTWWRSSTPPRVGCGSNRKGPDMRFTTEEVAAALATVRTVVPATPQFAWPLLARRLGMTVWVKHENHSPIGAFKVRGGLTYFEQLAKATKPRGV